MRIRSLPATAATKNMCSDTHIHTGTRERERDMRERAMEMNGRIFTHICRPSAGDLRGIDGDLMNAGTNRIAIHLFSSIKVVTDLAGRNLLLQGKLMNLILLLLRHVERQGDCMTRYKM